MTPEIISRVDAQIASEFTKDALGGVTVGLVSGPDLFWTKSYGFANMERKIPASAKTVYRIGSITKQFTGLMLLQLVREGKVQLADPVIKYFPEIDHIPRLFPDAPPITLLQLATHTAGLVREPDNAAAYRKGAVSDWEEVLIAALPQASYICKPGTQFNYSNIGYASLGAALGRAAGQPYVDYVRQRILAPLGMTHTSFELNDEMTANLARGYLLKNGTIDSEMAEREHRGRGYAVPNGGLYSTMEDLARFVSFAIGDGPAEVLTPEDLIKSRQQIVTFPANPQAGYGIGFMTIPAGGTLIYGHGGGVAGYQTEAYFAPHSKSGVIVLRNALGGRFETMDVVRSAYGSWPKEIAQTSDEAAEYVGHFGKPPYRFNVTQEGGQLSVQFAEFPAAKAFRSAKDEFFMKVVEVRIAFERGPDGKIKGLISRRAGRGDIRADKNSAAADSKP